MRLPSAVHKKKAMVHMFDPLCDEAATQYAIRSLVYVFLKSV
jgi:hypothetical protein